jgi:poly(hydroxyalkanoate) depolymerase family esterase
MRLVALLLALVLGVAATPRGSRYLHETLTANGDVYRYSVYVPSTYRAGLPLLVMIHGCRATDDREAAATGYDALAERKRFVVLYPDVDAADIAAGRCWKGLWHPQGEARGRGDAKAIAAMTRAVISAWHVDPSRVYAIGMSSGAFETSILGADYPDLYAAIGIHSGAAYDGAEQGCWGPRRPLAHTAALAREALAAMGPRARPVPVIVFHGDHDATIPYRCGRQALAQWLETDDRVLAREQLPRLPAAPTKVVRASVPDGHAYTVASYADATGSVAAELWTIHGMGHHWSGGSSARYDDPLGPSAAVASWVFFASHDRQDRIR